MNGNPNAEGARWPRALGRGLGLGLGLLALLSACNPASTPGSNAPGPSEASEDRLIATVDPDPAAETLDPELAAKQAAAQAVLDKVKDRDPEEEKKKLARSHAVSQQAKDKLAKGQLQDAVQVARQALKLHEQNVDAMLVIAEVYYKEGKYELVRAVTSSALQIDPKIRTPEETSRAYNLQGFAMLAMGEDNPATQSFKKAAEVDEKNASAWNNLGTRYLDAGDVSTAISCFQYAIELDPRFYKAQLNYGAALRANHQWEDAEAVLLKALELRPGYAEAYFNLGVLYLDADPFPGLETKARLNKAILNLSKYRELASGQSRPGPRTPGLGGAGNAPPPRVSKERADDFIRVANKGIEREDRRLEREKERGATAPATATPTGAGGEAVPADDTPTDDTPTEAVDPATEPGAPEQPTPQGPNPAKPEPPAPQGPEPSAPSQPTPQGPTKPAPQGPTTPAPAKPAPAKPTPQGPSTPTPTQPAPTPTQPAPTPPAPTPVQPAPAKPAPQGPSSPAPVQPTPVQPPPQAPSVQRPQSASLGIAPLPWKKVGSNAASRGTRFDPSTLSSMEADPVTPSGVDLAFGDASTRAASSPIVVVDRNPSRASARVPSAGVESNRRLRSPSSTGPA